VPQSRSQSACHPPMETMSFKRGFVFFRAPKRRRLASIPVLASATWPSGPMRAKAKLICVSFSGWMRKGLAHPPNSQPRGSGRLAAMRRLPLQLHHNQPRRKRQKGEPPIRISWKRSLSHNTRRREGPVPRMRIGGFSFPVFWALISCAEPSASPQPEPAWLAIWRAGRVPFLIHPKSSPYHFAFARIGPDAHVALANTRG